MPFKSLGKFVGAESQEVRHVSVQPAKDGENNVPPQDAHTSPDLSVNRESKYSRLERTRRFFTYFKTKQFWLVLLFG